MRTSIHAQVSGALALGLLCLPAVLAHGGGQMVHGGGAMNGSAMADGLMQDESKYPPTYFAHPGHSTAIWAHIILMTLAYVFALPLAVMFSIAASRYTLVTQFVFLTLNAAGVLVSIIYNAQTPDLYPNNVHHKIGWVITWVTCAHVLVSLVGWVAGAVKEQHRRSLSVEEHAFIPVATEAASFFSGDYRISNDSGQGTEPNTESLRSSSVSSEDGLSMPSPRKEYNDGGRDEDEDDLEEMPLSNPLPKSGLATKAAKVVSSRLWKYLHICYQTVDRIILPFGFVAFASGIVTFGRLFEGHAVFGGLAHWVKGGIFFWLGLFTLGRWTGSFGEIGWAWNLRPGSTKKWHPSAEFVESALIFTYGSTNIFLEHLGSSGEWTSQDFEHISITVLFLGGGLVGMLIESTRVRDLLNTTVLDAVPEYALSDEEREQTRPPTTYEFSMNPIPALVILLLGVMMSSHKQTTMIATMVHKQWGNLLCGGAIARGLTYVIMWLKPPKSMLPSRPPTELLASFGLISGGIIFMASSSDTVGGMVHYGLDEMFMYTVTMGLVGMLMAWEVLVLAIKGWAVRKEQRAPGRRFA